MDQRSNRGIVELQQDPRATPATVAAACPNCGSAARWFPESNAWGCDRCHQLVQPIQRPPAAKRGPALAIAAAVVVICGIATVGVLSNGEGKPTEASAGSGSSLVSVVAPKMLTDGKSVTKDVGNDVPANHEKAVTLNKNSSGHTSKSVSRPASRRTSKDTSDDTQAKFRCELDHDNGWCGGRCVSIDTSANCGRCGRTCSSYQKCINRDCADTGNFYD